MENVCGDALCDDFLRIANAHEQLQETTLGKYDSCTIPPGEVRKIENRRNDVCTMLVVIPYPPEA